MNLATALLYPYHAFEPRSQAFGATIIGTPGRGKLLALTYDDGPTEQWTPELLAILARSGVKATFFVVGKYVDKRPELLRRTVAEGHALGNHTYSHRSLFRLSAARIADELGRCAEAVERAGCSFSEVPEGKLCRPPYGRKRPGSLRAVRDLGYVPVLWSVTCWDWSWWATVATIDGLARRGTHGGDVILLHDGNGDREGASRRDSLVATERIVERCLEQGYEFVTVPELVARSAAR